MSLEVPEYSHVPLSRRALAHLLITDPPEGMDLGDRAALNALLKLLNATIHFRMHDRLESMKTAYAPFNPDLDSMEANQTAMELTASAQRLADELAEVLAAGSYEPIPAAVVEQAFEEEAIFRISMRVDFDSFEELIIYARGRGTSTTQQRRGVLRRKHLVEIDVFDRVCIYVRFKDAEHLTQKQRRSLPTEPGSTLLKLFRNIPVADLEMLFPNCEVGLRLRDKLLLGLPALVGGVPVLVKLFPAFLSLGVLLGISSRRGAHGISTIAAFTALIMLGAYLFRQWTKFKNRRVEFLKLLSENLYFRNLDNNEGVLTRLIDDAEEEVCKEVMLVYALSRAERAPLSEDEMDQRVEAFLTERLRRNVGFNTTRAVQTMLELGLAERDDDGRVAALAAPDALVLLDHHWDNFFPYANALRD